MIFPLSLTPVVEILWETGLPSGPITVLELEPENTPNEFPDGAGSSSANLDATPAAACKVKN